MNSNKPLSPVSDTTAMDPNDSESSRLEEAIRRGDDLLVHSLRIDEIRRRGRRRKIMLYLGGTIMIAACLSVFLLMQSGGNTTNADQLSQDGWQLWQQQHFNEAAEKFQQAVKINPNLPTAWCGHGWGEF